MRERPSPSARTVLATWDLVYGLADHELHATRSEQTGNWDIHNPDRPPAERIHDYLTVLGTVQSIQATLESLREVTVSQARRSGADFTAIGAVQGVSRQAARQAYERAATQHWAVLSGGPDDGRRVSRRHDQVVIRCPAPHPDGRAGDWWWDDEAEDDVIAVYRRRYGNPEIFDFQHLEDGNGTVLSLEPDRRPRIGDLAAAWGVDSRIVLLRAQTLDPAIRSPATRVDRQTLEQLTALLGGEGPSGSRHGPPT